MAKMNYDKLNARDKADEFGRVNASSGEPIGDAADSRSPKGGRAIRISCSDCSQKLEKLEVAKHLRYSHYLEDELILARGQEMGINAAEIKHQVAQLPPQSHLLPTRYGVQSAQRKRGPSRSRKKIWRVIFVRIIEQTTRKRKSFSRRQTFIKLILEGRSTQRRAMFLQLKKLIWTI